MIDIFRVRDEAAKELETEQFEAAKKQIKAKLKEIKNAEAIVANLKRELEDLYAVLGQ